MKSKKITSIKQARKIIEKSNILKIYYANLITWWDGDSENKIGYLVRDRNSRKIYLPVEPIPSFLRVIGKVFKYEVVCSFYGDSVNRDTSILWLKEAVNECTS